MFQLWLQHHRGSLVLLCPPTGSQLWLQPCSEGSAAPSAWALTVTGSGPCSGRYFDWPHFHYCFSSSHCSGQDFTSFWAETSAIPLAGSDFGSGPILGQDFDSGSCSGSKVNFGPVLSCCFHSAPSWSATLAPACFRPMLGCQPSIDHSFGSACVSLFELGFSPCSLALSLQLQLSIRLSLQLWLLAGL